MAHKDFPIDRPEDEILPASPARRNVATLTGCLFVLLVLVFLVWWGATYFRRPDNAGMPSSPLSAESAVLRAAFLATHVPVPPRATVDTPFHTHR